MDVWGGDGGMMGPMGDGTVFKFLRGEGIEELECINGLRTYLIDLATWVSDNGIQTIHSRIMTTLVPKCN